MTTNTISRAAIHDGDRQLRRTCVRFGDEFREIRLRVGVSQAAVARAVGVARSVICRLEQGDPDVSPRIRARAAAVLGADFRIAIYAEAAPMIHDAAHAGIVEAVLAMRHPSWGVTLESPVPGPGRRSSDIRLDRGLDTILIEVESRVRALEAIIRECAEKRVAVAASMGPERRVHVVLVLPPTRHHKGLVAAHPRIVATAFPAGHDALSRALADSSARWPGDGMLWVAPARRRSSGEDHRAVDVDHGSARSSSRSARSRPSGTTGRRGTKLSDPYSSGKPRAPQVGTPPGTHDTRSKPAARSSEAATLAR